MKIIVDAKELKKIGVGIDKAIKGIPKDKKDGLDWIGGRYSGYMRREVEAHRWSGDIENSIGVLEQTKDSVTIGADERKAPHNQYVLQGTGPHAAPFHKILDWTETKLGGSVDDAKAVWYSIFRFGTSVWTAQRYGHGNENPYPRRVIESREAKTDLEQLSLRTGKSIAARLAS